MFHELKMEIEDEFERSVPTVRNGTFQNKIW